MPEINHDDYRISYDPETTIITCTGSFRLRSEEYAPIAALLNEVIDSGPTALTLDVRELQFLNSSGISTLSKFILQLRNNAAQSVVVRGNNAISWQPRSLKNLQRLLPQLILELE
jgi:hypothetical protein